MSAPDADWKAIAWVLGAADDRADVDVIYWEWAERTHGATAMAIIAAINALAAAYRWRTARPEREARAAELAKYYAEFEAKVAVLATENEARMVVLDEHRRARVVRMAAMIAEHAARRPSQWKAH